MTREEEINKFINKFLTDLHGLKHGKDRVYLNDTYEASLIKVGVVWADNNPKSPWIKAKNELPTKGGLYLCMDENCNISALAFNGDRWINTTEFLDVSLDVVKYWVPIPNLPEE